MRESEADRRVREAFKRARGGNGLRATAVEEAMRGVARSERRARFWRSVRHWVGLVTGLAVVGFVAGSLLAVLLRACGAL